MSCLVIENSDTGEFKDASFTCGTDYRGGVNQHVGDEHYYAFSMRVHKDTNLDVFQFVIAQLHAFAETNLVYSRRLVVLSKFP